MARRKRKDLLGFSSIKAGKRARARRILNREQRMRLRKNVFSLAGLVSRMRGFFGIWHPDPRGEGDGDAGNLLEDLLGVPENNLSVADYGVYELKTHKKSSGALVKLFSLAPNPRPFSSQPFLEAVGWQDRSNPARLRFSFTSGVNGNSRGFRINRTGDTIQFIHDPRSVLRAELAQPYETDNTLGDYSDRIQLNPNYTTELPKNWLIRDTNPLNNDTIKARIRDKLQNVVFIERTQRLNPRTGVREHKFHHAWLLSTLPLSQFIQYIDDDVLRIDFNMRTGHDHGVAFRINRDRMVELFENSVRLI